MWSNNQVLVVLATTFMHWDDEGGEVRALDEEEYPAELVGVYTDLESCAEACYSFIDGYKVNDEPGEEHRGPLATLYVSVAETGGRPGAARFVTDIPIGGVSSQNELLEKIRQGLTV